MQAILDIYEICKEHDVEIAVRHSRGKVGLLVIDPEKKNGVAKLINPESLTDVAATLEEVVRAALGVAIMEIKQARTNG